MLLSSFLVLATAGATIDGRNIEEQWLKDAAELYSADEYTANINIDHYNWYGNYGQVVEVRLGENKDGKLTLEGRLNPNQYLLQMNKDGQKLFFSSEFTLNYAGTGKAYLTGLAMTDQPASLGTSQAKFSKGNNGGQEYTAPQEFTLKFPGDKTEPEDETTKSLLARILDKLPGGQSTEFTQKPTKQDEPEMSKEALVALQAQGEKNEKAIEKLTGTLTLLTEKLTAQVEGEAEPEEGTDVEKLSNKIVELETKISELQEEVPGKGGQENLGDAGKETEFV